MTQDNPGTGQLYGKTSLTSFNIVTSTFEQFCDQPLKLKERVELYMAGNQYAVFGTFVNRVRETQIL